MGDLQDTIRYQFRDRGLLDRAMTHRSFGADHNERLEYLGDAVLDLVVGEQLFRSYPNADEHRLTLLRAALVKKASLAEIARHFELGQHLRLGAGELRSGAFRRDSVLADALEALIGAVYLDAENQGEGLAAVRAIVGGLVEARLASLKLEQIQDPKTRLQEFLQGRHLPLPSYTVTAVSGPSHDQAFVVECAVPELQLRFAAEGRSRREAEREAAQLVLTALAEAPSEPEAPSGHVRP